MATQTTPRRQVATQKAAAARKRNEARRSATTTKAAAGRTTGRSLDGASARLDAFGRQAQRALYSQVGAAASVRDAVVSAARRYRRIDSVTRELGRFQQRGIRAVNDGRRAMTWRRRAFDHKVSAVQREIERQADGVRTAAGTLL
jgi:hypothetical protein